MIIQKKIRIARRLVKLLTALTILFILYTLFSNITMLVAINTIVIYFLCRYILREYISKQKDKIREERLKSSLTQL